MRACTVNTTAPAAVSRALRVCEAHQGIAASPGPRLAAALRQAGGGQRRAGRLVARAGDDGKQQQENFGDDLLDFMYAGRKLRRWYGAEGKVLPKDGQRPQQEQQEPGDEAEEDFAGPRETVVVLDADSSDMAEQVVLQLILKRSKVRAMVRDAAAAKAAFGPYVEAVQGDSNSAAALRSALKGAKAAVACGPLGQLLQAAAATRLPHVVLLSSVGAPRRGGFALFGGGEAGVLGDAGREAALQASAVQQKTVVRVGTLTDSPGGGAELHLAAGGSAGGSISREDAARVLAEAAEWEGSGALTLQAAAAGPGQPPERWQDLFDQLRSVPTA